MKTFILTIAILTSFSLLSQNDTLSVYFDHDKHTLIRSEENKLSQLNQQKIKIIAIHGFADPSGSSEYNKRLSQQRINSVRKELSLDQENDLNTIAFGEDQRNQKNNSQSNQERRRVDIIYFEQKNNPFASGPEPVKPIIEKKEKKQEEPSLVNNFETFLLDSAATQTTIQLSIHFHPGTDAFLNPQDPQLKELFDFLHYNQNVRAHIRGHVCCGPNQPVSHLRAYQVYKYLIKRSISPERLSYKGYSNTLPFVTPELTEADRIKNRRVDVIFIKE